jgi:hypothetical protein
MPESEEERRRRCIIDPSTCSPPPPAAPDGEQPFAYSKDELREMDERNADLRVKALGEVIAEVDPERGKGKFKDRDRYETIARCLIDGGYIDGGSSKDANHAILGPYTAENPYADHGTPASIHERIAQLEEEKERLQNLVREGETPEEKGLRDAAAAS